MAELQRRHKEQQLAARAANTALLAAQRAVTDCKSSLADIAAEKEILQQSIDQMQSQSADNAQVGVVHVGVCSHY